MRTAKQPFPPECFAAAPLPCSPIHERRNPGQRLRHRRPPKRRLGILLPLLKISFTHLLSRLSSISRKNSLDNKKIADERQCRRDSSFSSRLPGLTPVDLGVIIVALSGVRSLPTKCSRPLLP